MILEKHFRQNTYADVMGYGVHWSDTITIEGVTVYNVTTCSQP